MPKNKQISLSTGTEKIFNLDFAAISHKLYASKVTGCLGANSCRAIFLSSSISASCTALSKSSSDCSSSSWRVFFAERREKKPAICCAVRKSSLLSPLVIGPSSWKQKNTSGNKPPLPGRLFVRWESRSPMDGHFSEKINMNNCIQSFFFGKFGYHQITLHS